MLLATGTRMLESFGFSLTDSAFSSVTRVSCYTLDYMIEWDMVSEEESFTYILMYCVLNGK